MITIEKTTETGYEEKDYQINEALEVLNIELKNERTLWINGNLYDGDIITKDSIPKGANISVTNRLVGG